MLALNNAHDHRIGSVGKPIESVEYRFAADGELLVERALCLYRLLAQTGSHRARPSKPMAGSTPAISRARTRMDFSTSPTARRN